MSCLKNINPSVYQMSPANAHKSFSFALSLEKTQIMTSWVTWWSIWIWSCILGPRNQTVSDNLVLPTQWTEHLSGWNDYSVHYIAGACANVYMLLWSHCILMELVASVMIQCILIISFPKIGPLGNVWLRQRELVLTWGFVWDWLHFLFFHILCRSKFCTSNT